jgi:hypothetical protein
MVELVLDYRISSMQMTAWLIKGADTLQNNYISLESAYFLVTILDHLLCVSLQIIPGKRCKFEKVCFRTFARSL